MSTIQSFEVPKSSTYLSAAAVWAIVTAALVGLSQPARAVAAAPESVSAASPDKLAARPFAEFFVVAGGYAGAIDGLKEQLAGVLKQRKVLLVWVMDRSQGMEDDHEEVMTRIEYLYQELGLTSPEEKNKLRMGVVSYGAATTNHTPQPTSDINRILSAIRAAGEDAAGKELQCAGIKFGIETFGKVAAAERRELVLVLVSDESGDHESNVVSLEPTIELAKKANCRVNVFGREAIFGYAYANVSWIHKESRTSHWLRVDRGPESPEPELLQTNGFHRRNDAMPSGFGPYEQMRIARETGGVFYLLPSPEVRLVGRDTRNYDPTPLYSYAPDLSARETYIAGRDESPLRKMVAQVVNDLDPYRAGSKGSRTEVRTDRFPIDPAGFISMVQAETRKAKDLLEYLKEAQKSLESVASSRNGERSLRWQANYDLTYAQTIAYQVRLKEYCWYLEEFVKNPKPVKNILGAARPTNGWWVHTVPRLLKPEETKADREKADALLAEIQKKYPQTPWAARANDETKRGYGIELVEGHDDVRGRAGIVLPKL